MGNDHQVVWDTYRTIVMVGGLAIIAFVLVTLVVYGWQQIFGKSKVHPHVFFVSLSYAALLGYLIADMTDYIGAPLTWRLPVGAFSIILGGVGMWNLYRNHLGREINENP